MAGARSLEEDFVGSITSVAIMFIRNRGIMGIRTIHLTLLLLIELLQQRRQDTKKYGGLVRARTSQLLPRMTASIYTARSELEQHLLVLPGDGAPSRSLPSKYYSIRRIPPRPVAPKAPVNPPAKGPHDKITPIMLADRYRSSTFTRGAIDHDIVHTVRERLTVRKVLSHHVETPTSITLIRESGGTETSDANTIVRYLSNDPSGGATPRAYQQSSNHPRLISLPGKTLTLLRN